MESLSAQSSPPPTLHHPRAYDILEQDHGMGTDIGIAMLVLEEMGDE